MSSWWDQFATSIQEGCREGLQPVAPRTGRGLFSFGTERERDERELIEHYRRVRKQFDQSPFGDFDKLDLLVERVFDTVSESGARFDASTIIGCAFDPIAELMYDELFVFPDLDASDLRLFSLQQAAQLRRYLRRKEKHLARGGTCLELVEETAGTILREVLLHLPEQGASRTGSALQFDGSLLDVVERPIACIEGVLATLCDPRLEPYELFADVLEQLDGNLRVASGYDANDTRPSGRLVRPADAKGSPAQIADAYLRHTPLAKLFEGRVPLAIPNDTRFEHCHILGGTGHGKTQLLLKLIHYDLTENPEQPSIVVIDSQGDLIRTISRLDIFDPDEPDSLADRLVIIDPADVEFPACLNLFDVARSRLSEYGPADRERLQNGVVELFEYMFATLLGAELTQKQGVIFKFLARLLLTIPGATIQTLLEIMSEGQKFRPYMERLDGAARHFFASEFFDPSFTQTKKQIAKRLWGILANPVFERMFSHPENKLDLFDAMNNGKIVLISTGKDILKEEGCAIFGRFFIAQVLQAAMERATIAERERKPTFLYIDEAQDYLDDNIASLVNQARKYRVGLTFAHQNLDQLSTSLRAAVLASTSLKFAGGVSAKDARTIAEDMRVDPDVLQAMRKRRGVTEFACFSKNRMERAISVSIPLGTVNALPALDDDQYKALIDANRDHYCVPLDLNRPVLAVEVATPVIPTAVQQADSTPPAAKAQTPTKRADPYIAGQGGKRHKYLQQLIRQAGQERGYLATVEAQVSDGSVDVSLDGHGHRIACEISVTTSIEHEVANAKKALGAGFTEVWVLTENSRRSTPLQAALNELGSDAVSAMHPADAIARLEELRVAAAETEGTVRGYKVRTRRAASSNDEAQRRRETIAGVLARSSKRPPAD